MLVDFQLLGPFEAWASGSRLNVGSANQQALLAALVLDIGETVPVERLAGVLWEGRPPVSYRAQLYKRVHALRAVLGADAIATEDSGYRLDLAPVCSDLHRFNDLVARGRQARADGRVTDAIELFGKALALWQRPALDGVVSSVLRADAARLDEHRAQVIRERQELERRKGNGHRKAPACQRESPASEVPACLPMDMPSFTGRSAELAALDRALNAARYNSNAVVISLITGTAGVGKTALALHWAHRARRLFPDGQLYVNLRGFDRSGPMTVGDALTMLLRQLGTPSDQIPPETDVRALRYRSTVDGKRLVVVLDNAAGTEQVEPLLPGSPGCLVLVTGRTTMTGLVALHDARAIPLDTLSTVESVTLLGRLLGQDRTSDDPRATAELAELCGRLPLALRIAAANLAARRDTAIADMVAELRATDRLDQLRVDGAPRADVAAAFDLSYAAVRPASQRLLRLLSIAPGQDITPDAATALCGADSAGLLSELAAMHLVEPYRRGRYRLHDLIRLYARSKCDATDDATALAVYYLRTTDAATAALATVANIAPRPDIFPAHARTFADDAAALAWLTTETDNLVATATWAHAEGADLLCVHLVDALRGFFWSQRHTASWLSLGELGLACARRLADRGLEALMHRTLGLANAVLERADTAIEHSQAAVRLFEETGQRETAARMRLTLALHYTAHCRLEPATEQAEQALAYARDHDDPGVEASASITLMDCQMGLGRIEWTAETANRLLSLPVTQADKQLQAQAHVGRGWARHELGMIPEAMDDFSKAVELCDSIGNRGAAALHRAMLGRVLLDAGDGERAAGLLARARAELRKLVPRWECEAVHGLALVALHQGRLDEALSLETEAIDIASAHDFPASWTEALVGLSRIRLALGDTDGAADAARTAIDLGERSGWRLQLGNAHLALASAAHAAGRTDEARTHATVALDLHRAYGQRHREAEDGALLAAPDPR